MIALAGALVTAAAVSAPAAGRVGGSGVVTVADLVASDRRRLDATAERVRADRAALAGASSPAAAPAPGEGPAPGGDPAPSGADALGASGGADQPPGTPEPDPLRRRAELAAQVGLTAVRGPAVTVELDDAPRESRGRPLAAGVPSPGPNDLVVHQQDVQAVVNALWTGGAEAMAIMNHRVTPRTAVRCVGNTLLLNGQVYSPPFRITAIGDPAALRTALDADRGVRLYRDYVDAYGLRYDVSSSADALVPAYEGSLLEAAGQTPE